MQIPKQSQSPGTLSSDLECFVADLIHQANTQYANRGNQSKQQKKTDD
jgi:hypothetical protein